MLLSEQAVVRKVSSLNVAGQATWLTRSQMSIIAAMRMTA